jgi:hypothetical protein
LIHKYDKVKVSFCIGLARKNNNGAMKRSTIIALVEKDPTKEAQLSPLHP